jgi:hypothetical protein
MIVAHKETNKGWGYPDAIYQLSLISSDRFRRVYADAICLFLYYDEQEGLQIPAVSESSQREDISKILITGIELLAARLEVRFLIELQTAPGNIRGFRVIVLNKGE